ncbi:MAG TPA: cytochrome P450 [Candidatus Binatia bacterium]|jgi:cytochrome P450|nr:cytochrome P450 [Candidatus Binatia bacterium]
MEETAKALRNGSHAPSGPKGSFILGNLPEMRRDPMGLLLRAARDHGDVSRLTLVEKFTLLNHPDDVRHVLLTRYEAFAKTRLTVRIKPIVGEGLLTSDGDFWRRQRKLAQPAFHRTRLASFADTMAALTGEALAGWRDGDVIDVSDAMSRLTLRVIGRTMMGAELSDAASKVGRALTTALAVTNDRFRRLSFFPWLPTPSNIRFDRAMKVLDGLVASIIAERRAGGPGRDDLLSMFMEAQDADTGERMTDKQLRDEAMTMLLAGHETTSNALSWAFHLLALHPEAEERVRAEAAAAFGDGVPTFETLRKLPYSRWTIMEAMRLYPPVWLFARTATADVDLPRGHRVRAGENVFICPYALHRDPVLWPDPERFDPERFSEANAAGRHRCAYVPFSQGPRQCIGNEFALMEAAIILSMTCRDWHLFHARARPPEPEPSITLRPKDGMPMTLTRR